MKSARILIVMAFFLAGCAGVQTNVSLQSDSTNKTVSLIVGEVLSVTLDSNPTTGYKWEMTEAPDASVLSFSGTRFEAPKSAPAGAGGKEVWEFKAERAGKTSFTLEYRRSWESNAVPAKKFSLTVNVIGQ
jgi:inhibitor of cysteine peptidase